MTVLLWFPAAAYPHHASQTFGLLTENILTSSDILTSLGFRLPPKTRRIMGDSKRQNTKTKQPPRGDCFVLVPGSCLSSHAVASTVLSVYEGLTSVFGMGTGGAPQLNHRNGKIPCEYLDNCIIHIVISL